MSTIPEIEAAIEKLSRAQVEELAAWLNKVLLRRPKRPAIDRWLERARGAAVMGTTTAAIMALTRGEE
jgi:cytochrome c553